MFDPALSIQFFDVKSSELRFVKEEAEFRNIALRCIRSFDVTSETNFTKEKKMFEKSAPI